MPRSPEHNSLARQRSRERLLQAAIEVFAERGAEGATITDITTRAGVAQGMVNYHFGGKRQLVTAVIERWFEILLGMRPSDVFGDDGHREDAAAGPDRRLADIIDTALGMTAVALPLQRVVVALRQDPVSRAQFAAVERRHLDALAAAEDTVRAIFAERGDADPAVEEIMLRSLLEGIVVQCIVYGDTYPLEAARRWVHRRYGLEEPMTPLPSTLPSTVPPGAAQPRVRASR